LPHQIQILIIHTENIQGMMGFYADNFFTHPVNIITNFEKYKSTAIFYSCQSLL
jgi:hypothetical protein